MASRTLQNEKDTDWWNDDVAAAAAAAASYDYVRFTAADMHGIARSRLIPRRHVVDKLQTGVTICSLTLGTRSEFARRADVTAVSFRNAVARAMPDTLRALPWATSGRYRIGEVLCESFWNRPYPDGAPHAACTRYLARTQLERLSTLGYQLMSSFEAEFFMYRKDGAGELTSRPMFHGVDTFSGLILAEHEELMCSMDEGLSAAGVDVVGLQSENAPGQLEFATNTKFGVESADQMFTLKEAVKEIGLQHGWQATFMTKPTGEPGNSSGMHFSGSLWKDGENVFHDSEETCWGSLSAEGRHWAAGVIKHAGALTALVCPTVNCYRRLRTAWAPDRAVCGWDKLTSMLRFVTSDPRTTYVENRLPSSAANPYLVLAATVAAGIDGLVNRLELSQDSDDRGKMLPSSLSEALTALEADKVMCEALGEEFIRWFLTLKRDVEIAKVNKAKEAGQQELEIERELYFTFL